MDGRGWSIELQQGRLIAIGDIHGCVEALNGLLHWVSPTVDDHFIILGDVVDRGLSSKSCVDTLIMLGQTSPVAAIMGNHEEMMLNFLNSGNADAFRYWVQYGGAETIESYGNVRKMMLEMPSDHAEFYQRMMPYIETEHTLFTHANYLPDRDFAQTPYEVLRWQHLREDQLMPHFSNRPVIVGHTAQYSGSVFNRGFMVCIDTACYAGGRLTAMDVSEGMIWQVDMVGRPITETPVHITELVS